MKKKEKMTNKEREAKEWILREFDRMKERIKHMDEVIDSQEYGISKKIHLLYEDLGRLKYQISQIDLVYLKAKL